MRDVLSHRGPDGHGLFVDGPVGLGHRRLAIVDISAAGEQPMSNEDGSVWIAFNGEIYNHARLRPALESRGHQYRSRCDTETIVHLYEEDGDDLVERLRGMFAFAIWDRRARRLLLARDRLGIKPLYYAQTATALVFGSEIKALLASGLIKPVLNESVLPEYLSSRFVSGEETFFRGIRKLLPGHVLTWSAGEGIRVRRYWTPPAPEPADPGVSIDAQARVLRGHLESAVERHLMSDVPVGVFLSGGLDSSALAAMMAHARRSGAPGEGTLQSFSVGFDEAEANELSYARLAADAIGTEHRDVTVSADRFFGVLPRLVWHEDEPIAFPSSVPLYFVSSLARQHVKVVLTGEGADELFLGYNRYRVTSWNTRLGRPYWAAAPGMVRRAVRGVVRALPSRLGRVGARTFLARDPGVRSLFLENFAVYDEPLQRELFARPELIDARDRYEVPLSCFAKAEGGLLERLSSTDLQTYLHELLMKQDQMSMAASIESRVPFLDDELVRYVASVPGRYRVRGWETKAIFRRAVADLIPRPILTRPKMGFPVPLDRWFAGRFHALVDEFVLGPRARDRGLFNPAALASMADEHKAGRRRHGDRLWLLVNLEIWQRIFADGEDPSTVMRTPYANALDQDGRPLAVDDRRAGAKSQHHLGPLPAA